MEEYFSVFKKLRGYFGQDNILIGGSYAYSKYLNLRWNKKDIDIFILIPRMETWALVTILKNIFDNVHTFDYGFSTNMAKAQKNKDNYYKIDNQWKRIVCNKNGMTYDLIFVDTDIEELIFDNTGSDISRIYYELTYSRYILRLTNFSKDAICRLESKICIIHEDKCTDAYVLKIKKLCNYLGFKIWKK